jgi:hypothetical protein
VQARSRSRDPCSNAEEGTPLCATAALTYAGTVAKTISEDDVESIEWKVRGGGTPGHRTAARSADVVDVDVDVDVDVVVEAAALDAALNGKP